MSDKQLVMEVVRDLPDSMTLKEISRKVSQLADLEIDRNNREEEEWEITPEIRAKIERGEADIAAGRFHTHAEVKEMIAQWRSK